MNDSSPIIEFRALYAQEPSTEITRNVMHGVMQRIDRSRAVHGRIRATGYGLVAIGTIVAFIPTARFFVEGLTQSGFLDYASLLVSDSSFIMSDWKEFAFSVLESVPILGSTGAVALILVFTVSARTSIRSMHTMYVRGGRAHREVTA